MLLKKKVNSVSLNITSAAESKKWIEIFCDSE